MEFSTMPRSALFLMAVAIVSGCKPFSNGTSGGCSIANYATSSPTFIGPAESDGHGNTWGGLAQSFVTLSGTTVSHIDLEMETVLAPGTLSIAGQSLTLGVYKDSATSFSGTPAPTLPSSQSLGVQVVATDSIPVYPQFVTFSFTPSLSVSANTPYWIILGSSFAQNSPSYVAWLANIQSDTFATGFALFENLTTGSYGPENVYGANGAYVDFVFRLGCT